MENREPPHRQQLDHAAQLKGDEDVVWHALDPAAALEQAAARSEGLSAAEAAVRLGQFGPNALPEPSRRGPLARLLAQFNNLLIYVLIASGIVTALLGHWTDTLVIFAVVILNAVIGFWQEGRAEDSLAAVRSMLSAHASVLRDGVRLTLPATDLVPGDVVLLEAGDRVPADLRLLDTRGLRAQEAALTGESVPVVKDTVPVAHNASLGDRDSMAFSGTLITSGRGVGLVVATGSRAEIGRIGAMLEGIEEITTPLLRQIDRFARWLTLVILAASGAVFAFAVLARGYAPQDAFLVMVGMAVAAIPEGLPAVLTITLALGVQRMARRHAIIRKLPAVETLGALLALAHKTGLDPIAERARHRRLDDIPFDAAHRFMATLNQDGAGGNTITVKGAPDHVITLCANQIAGDGVAPLEHEAWLKRIDALAREGQRVLAFAVKFVGDQATLGMNDMAEGFTLLGIAGFIDPPRPEAIEAVADCARAGIDVKMITGDHAVTALAIAGQLGLNTRNGVLTGNQIEAMDDEELRRRVADVDVFARAAPEHKLRLVEALQACGKVVAMTGDGVNDAPALKRADVGVAMGIKGTEAAKEAARVVLADDNFASIVAAVREGRTIYDNIRKVIAWTLPTNGGESLVIVGAILLGFVLPVSPVQILWINMVTAVALGLTLSFEPAEPSVMERRPRPSNASLLDMEMVWRIVLVSILFAGAVFALFFWSIERGDELAYARTLVVNLIVVMEIFYLFSVRYLHLTSLTFTGVVGTPAVLLGVGLTVILQLVFTYAPFMQAVFETRPIALADGAIVIGIGVGLLLLLEAEKVVRRRLL